MILSWTYLLIAVPSVIALAVFMLFYFQTLLPMKRLEFYKKQGVKTVFLPLAKRFQARLQNVIEKGDYFYEEKNLSQTDPTQKIVAYSFGSQVMVSIQGTEYMKELFLHPAPFVKAKHNNLCKFLLGNGMLFIEGEQWKLRRKLISSSFHYDFIHSNTKLIQETTKELLDKIDPSEYNNFLILNKIQEITGEVVGRTFFGRSLSRYTFEGKPMTLVLADLMAELGEVAKLPLYLILNTKIFMLPIKRFKKLAKQIADYRILCNKIIQDRKAENRKYNDLLDALLAQQRDAPVDSEERLTDEIITNEFITFFMAGMDTTARLVTMVLYSLTQHPESRAKLREEQAITYNSESEPTIETIQKMNVMNCLIKETLRHYCPTSTILFREAARDVRLKDITIKKGTLIKTDPFALFFNEDHFEEPPKFRPERWLTANPKMDPFSFIPFSAGPRNCIGQHLATLEAKIIVSEFMKKFDFKVSEGYKLKMMARLLYEPFEPMKMDLVRK